MAIVRSRTYDERKRQREARGMRRSLDAAGLDSKMGDAFLQANPDAMRYPSQAVDKAKEFARSAAQAQAAQAAAFGSIASRSDPNAYGSVASRRFPGMFGPGSASQQSLQPQQAAQGMQRRSEPNQPKNYADLMKIDPVERVRARGRKAGVTPVGGPTGLRSNSQLSRAETDALEDI
jgi:hypothetical protein